ncbi:MAG: ACT domain-containing protein [Chitinispirillaceae bacterium]
MKVQQISVFLENKAGRLASVAQALRDSRINIRALTIADSADFGVLRMIVNDPEKALSVLRDAGFLVKTNPIVAVQIEDREGLFFEIMNLCDREGINVEYTYSFVEQTSNRAILFIRFEDTDKAVKLFEESGFRLLSAEEISKL